MERAMTDQHVQEVKLTAGEPQESESVGTRPLDFSAPCCARIDLVYINADTAQCRSCGATWGIMHV
jgi:hypothetical protein